MKRDRKESYADFTNTYSPVSPPELHPKRYAILWFENEENESKTQVTTHGSKKEVLDYIAEGGVDEYAPDTVVDLDTGDHWEVDFTPVLEEAEGDFFTIADEADEEEEEAKP